MASFQVWLLIVIQIACWPGTTVSDELQRQNEPVHLGESLAECIAAYPLHSSWGTKACAGEIPTIYLAQDGAMVIRLNLHSSLLQEGILTSVWLAHQSRSEIQPDYGFRDGMILTNMVHSTKIASLDEFISSQTDLDDADFMYGPVSEGWNILHLCSCSKNRMQLHDSQCGAKSELDECSCPCMRIPFVAKPVAGTTLVPEISVELSTPSTVSLGISLSIPWGGNTRSNQHQLFEELEQQLFSASFNCSHGRVNHVPDLCNGVLQYLRSECRAADDEGNQAEESVESSGFRGAVVWDVPIGARFSCLLSMNDAAGRPASKQNTVGLPLHWHDSIQISDPLDGDVVSSSTGTSLEISPHNETLSVCWSVREGMLSKAGREESGQHPSLFLISSSFGTAALSAQLNGCEDIGVGIGRVGLHIHEVEGLMNGQLPMDSSKLLLGLACICQRSSSGIPHPFCNSRSILPNPGVGECDIWSHVSLSSRLQPASVTLTLVSGIQEEFKPLLSATGHMNGMTGLDPGDDGTQIQKEASRRNVVLSRLADWHRKQGVGMAHPAWDIQIDQPQDINFEELLEDKCECSSEYCVSEPHCVSVQGLSLSKYRLFNPCLSTSFTTVAGKGHLGEGQSLMMSARAHDLTDRNNMGIMPSFLVTGQLQILSDEGSPMRFQDLLTSDAQTDDKPSSAKMLYAEAKCACTIGKPPLGKSPGVEDARLIPWPVDDKQGGESTFETILSLVSYPPETPGAVSVGFTTIKSDTTTANSLRASATMGELQFIGSQPDGVSKNWMVAPDLTAVVNLEPAVVTWQMSGLTSANMECASSLQSAGQNDKCKIAEGADSQQLTLQSAALGSTPLPKTIKSLLDNTSFRLHGGSGLVPTSISLHCLLHIHSDPHATVHPSQNSAIPDPCSPRCSQTVHSGADAESACVWLAVAHLKEPWTLSYMNVMVAFVRTKEHVLGNIGPFQALGYASIDLKFSRLAFGMCLSATQGQGTNDQEAGLDSGLLLSYGSDDQSMRVAYLGVEDVLRAMLIEWP